MMRKILFYLACAGAVAAAFSAVFLFTKMKEQRAYVDELIRSTSSAGRHDPSGTAIALSQAIYQRTDRTAPADALDAFSRWESLSLFNVTSAVSLRYGIYGVDGHSVEGACGTMSRTLLNALWALDIPARKLQLLDDAQGAGGGHTLVEFYDNGRWLVISPSDSAFVWRKRDGTIATADEIKADPALYEQIRRWRPNFPYRFDNYRNIRWEKLPGVARKMARAVLGRARYENATTPRLYEKPRTLFMMGSLSLLAFFALLATLIRPRSRTL